MDKLPSIFTKIQDEDKFQKLIYDLVAEFVLDRSRPYLTKYEEIENYAEIIEAQNFIREIAIIIVEHNLSTGKNLIKKSKLSALSEGIQEIICIAFLENVNAIKKQAVQRMIAMSLYTLVDFNWNLNITVASDNISSAQIPFLLLQLVLKKFGEENEKRIELEFSKTELDEFMEKLKQIQKTILDQQDNEQENNQ